MTKASPRPGADGDLHLRYGGLGGNGRETSRYQAADADTAWMIL